SGRSSRVGRQAFAPRSRSAPRGRSSRRSSSPSSSGSRRRLRPRSACTRSPRVSASRPRPEGGVGKQIVINAAPWETRVAVLEATTLVELHIERRREVGIAGNIYKGNVLRVLPGMQAAFIDIGLAKAAFLHASDVGGTPLPPEVAREGDAPELVEAPPAPEARPIEERLKKGQDILVQIAKEPIGTKGARGTAHLSP